MNHPSMLNGNIIISLDANIIRNLCYEECSWVEDFEKMSKENYHFCLPDYALFEFINQFVSKSKKVIPLDNFQKGIKQLSRFISEDFPVLFGGNKLFQISGFKIDDCDTTFDPSYYQAYSKAIYSFLIRVDRPSFFEKEKMTFSVDNKTYEAKLKIDLIEQIFQNDREQWIKFIVELSKNVYPHHNLKDQFYEISYIKEKMSEWIFARSDYIERVDIISKFIYSFILNSNLKKKYNPSSKNNKNDGIDFKIIFFHLIPTIICSVDHFITKIQNLNSYQNNWFYKPSELVKAWKNNIIIKPSFR